VSNSKKIKQNTFHSNPKTKANKPSRRLASRQSATEAASSRSALSARFRQPFSLGFRWSFLLKRKGKGVPVHVMKAALHLFLTSALDGGKCSASHTRPLYPKYRTLIANRKLGGPQSQSGQFAEEKYVCPNRDPNPGPFIP